LKELWKEVHKVHSRFCKKLIGIPNCAAHGFAEMELGTENKRGKCIGQILKYSYRIMCLEMEEPIKLCYECQNSNMRVKSSALDLKEELLAFMWEKQQECNMR
jgi:hypothetical protein